MTKSMACLLVVVAVGLNFGASAVGAVIRYDSQSAFVAASTGLTTDSFAGLDSSGNGYTFIGTTVTRGDMTITNTNAVYAVTWGFGPCNEMPDGGTCLTGDGNTITDITFAPGHTAVGLDTFALNNPATVYGVVTFSDNTTLDFSKAATVPFTTPPSYLGFIVNTPGVTILKISTNLPTQNGFAFSEVSLGTAVPEPASLMLLVTGLVGLSWRKRR